jgi:hypothetical protein
MLRTMNIAASAPRCAGGVRRRVGGSWRRFRVLDSGLYVARAEKQLLDLVSKLGVSLRDLRALIVDRHQSWRGASNSGRLESARVRGYVSEFRQRLTRHKRSPVVHEFVADVRNSRLWLDPAQ